MPSIDRKSSPEFQAAVARLAAVADGAEEIQIDPQLRAVAELHRLYPPDWARNAYGKAALAAQVCAWLFPKGFGPDYASKGQQMEFIATRIALAENLSGNEARNQDFMKRLAAAEGI